MLILERDASSLKRSQTNLVPVFFFFLFWALVLSFILHAEWEWRRHFTMIVTICKFIRFQRLLDVAVGTEELSRALSHSSQDVAGSRKDCGWHRTTQQGLQLEGSQAWAQQTTIMLQTNNSAFSDSHSPPQFVHVRQLFTTSQSPTSRGSLSNEPHMRTGQRRRKKENENVF